MKWFWKGPINYPKPRLKLHWDFPTGQEYSADAIPLKVSGELLRFKQEGEMIPKWYGLAYYDFDSDIYAYLPIPLNYIVASYRWLREHIKFIWIYGITDWEKPLIQANRQAIRMRSIVIDYQDKVNDFKDQLKNEYVRGFVEGGAAAEKSMLDNFDRYTEAAVKKPDDPKV